MSDNQKYTLFGYWRSSASWRIRWALELKGLSYEYVPVNLVQSEQKSLEHLARNPLGKVPVLKTPEGDLLTQSLSILEYLEEVHPPAILYPVSPLERARCRALCEVINADTAPFQTPFVQKRHSSDAAEQLNWAQEWIRKGFGAFDKLLPNRDGPYSFGERPTMADLFLVPQIYNAVRYQIPVAIEYPALWNIYEIALKTEACIKASPEEQSDAQQP
ncbi:maleylacetoacetate isomerase [bacterium]|nr:maleylacetoacetate isomerase [bacterium]